MNQEQIELLIRNGIDCKEQIIEEIRDILSDDTDIPEYLYQREPVISQAHKFVKTLETTTLPVQRAIIISELMLRLLENMKETRSEEVWTLIQEYMTESMKLMESFIDNSIDAVSVSYMQLNDMDMDEFIDYVHEYYEHILVFLKAGTYMNEEAQRYFQNYDILAGLALVKEFA